MVRKERLELSRVAPLEPKSSASTNSATLANLHRLTAKRGRLKSKIVYRLPEAPVTPP